jgi:plastocyanin
VRALLILLAIGIIAVIAIVSATFSEPQQSSASHGIHVTDEGFFPQSIYIYPGTTVTWVWEGSNPHSVTSSFGLFDSGVHTAPHTFSYTFTQGPPTGGPYEYPYYSVPDGGENGPIGYVYVERAGTPTSTPTPVPTITPNPQPGDVDGDAVPDAGDNCPTTFNPDQANWDDAPRNNGTMLSGGDVTIPNSDGLGNSCDDDDDNDGLSDTTEQAGPPCPPWGWTISYIMDSDWDHLHDGWECATDTDPSNSTSHAYGMGTDDLDGDHVPDLWEARGYNASGASTDSDGDGCADLVEIASIDSNKAIGDTDRLAVARRALGIWGPEGYQDLALDISKNRVIGDEDRLFVARAALMPDWLPKSCT